MALFDRTKGKKIKSIFNLELEIITEEDIITLLPCTVKSYFFRKYLLNHG